MLERDGLSIKISYYKAKLKRIKIFPGSLMPYKNMLRIRK